VGEDHSSESGVFGRTRTGFTDSSFQRAQKDSLDSMFVFGILEKETNAFGHGQHHLPERDKRKHIVDEMGGGLGHVLCITTRA
jgi:hypothetical protein